MIPKWSTKFELRPGKWVFVPTMESITAGMKIKSALEDCWTPPSYYYHLRSGGHVAAIQSHLEHTSFLHIDIQDFFGSINRSRLTRCLKNKFGYGTAREMANASTVRHPGEKARYILPYGFVQSQILAAVCLEESALGIYLDKLNKTKDVSLSVYVDDIIVSCDNVEKSTAILENIIAAAAKARFILNADKQEGPAAKITAFNILVSNGSMKVETNRFQKFVEDFSVSSSERKRAGILSYVKSVNVDQAGELKD